MITTERLFQIADKLAEVSQQAPLDELSALENAATEAGRAWSGSWLGYHSRVYYVDLQPVPPGARFSIEWGTRDLFANEGTIGDWAEYDFDQLVEHIKTNSKVEDVECLVSASEKAKDAFEDFRAEMLSLLTPILAEKDPDAFLQDIANKARSENVPSYADWVAFFRPTGKFFSRDMNAVQAGMETPPHFSVLAEMGSIKTPYTACEKLGKLARRATSHLENLEKKNSESKRIGTNVFIGHGRSLAWRDLKDFVQDRLHLPWDEFNRVPVAGFTNIARLSQMLDSAAIAFIIMTAEDEQMDGKLHARMNVIHEAGLFQGRLGFEKAILLLEDGCEEFSNVQGLGQIRFPAGNISAMFEEIRRVLERESLCS
jgi:hypothetical protein